jgi:hypothetical protein
VIVRIATEGQYELPQEAYERVNELDNQAVEAVEAGDEARFREIFAELIAMVRERGRELGDEELVHSDVILPPEDTDLEEAKLEFSGEGAIPDSLIPD